MSSEAEPSSQLARDILDSDRAFRAEFDRSSTTFHGGSTEAVPLGGSRVPKSMTSVRSLFRAPLPLFPQRWSQSVDAAAGDHRLAALAELRQSLNKLKRSAVSSGAKPCRGACFTRYPLRLE